MPLAAMVIAAPDFAATVDVSNRSEVRGRATQGGSPPNPSMDLVDMPVARLELSNRIWQGTLGYAAVGLLPDVEQGLQAPQLLHSADVGATWRDRHVRVELAEYGQYGQQNSAILLGGGAPPLVSPPSVTPAGGGTQPLTAPVTIQYGSSRTALSSQLVLSRRWSGGTMVDYTIQGGLDATSQRVAPLVREPRIEATVAHALTRIDSVETRVAALRGDASSAPCSAAIMTVSASDACAPEIEEGQIEESWSHRLSRTTQASVGAGASLVRMHLRPTDPFVDATYPFARASLERARRQAKEVQRLRFEALLAPVLDVRTGILDERLQGTVSASFPIGRVVVSGSALAARSIASPFVQPSTYVQAVAEAEYTLSTSVAFGGGIRYAWQEQIAVGTFSGEMIFAQITLRAPTVRF